ncbi:MAG: protoporphyrinogen oxidase [Chlamydiales bacterium]
MTKEKKTRVIVLGGGISGLALAWYLSKQNVDLLLLEKEARVGGLIGSGVSEEFFFERGPRMFQESRSQPLLDLIDEVGLRSELIYADQNARGRYIWHKEKLLRVPSNPLTMLFSPLTRPLLRALLTEWKKAPFVQEESIWDFAVRRFNKKSAERLFDPLMTGIYAGDIKRLSVNACFPQMKRWEEEHGSLTRGFFIEKRRKSTLFSLQGGSERLIYALQEKLKGKILSGEKVGGLRVSSRGITVETTEGQREADHIFSALPPHELSRLLGANFDFPVRDVVTVNLGYRAGVLTKKGFGYLVPSHANQEIFGVIFDSHLFPQQNRSKDETRLTVMLPPGGDEQARALNALKRHLQIHQKPDFIYVTKITKALPQFELGHAARIEKLKSAARTFSPHLHLVGNFLTGPSVSDAIATSRDAASQVFGRL